MSSAIFGSLAVSAGGARLAKSGCIQRGSWASRTL